MSMRKHLLSILIMVTGISIMSAGGFSNETLNYVVSYKWGLVHKDAGDATITLQRHGGNYKITLYGKTKSWADSFYEVRDTLESTVSINGLKPQKYIKTSHEGGKYGKDAITFRYSGSSVKGDCTRYRDKKGKISESSISLTAHGPTYDMLSVFYYLRTLDYSHLSAGEVEKVNMFSGTKLELLTIKYEGKEKVKMKNKTEKEAYHIKFNFTSEGKKKSSDDIDAWISTDSRHIPLLIVGKLAIGQIKCYYVG